MFHKIQRSRVYKRKRSEPQHRKIGELDADTKKWAAFADTSYAENKRERLGEHIKDHKSWVLDEPSSSKHRTVFVNEKTKQVVTSFRGTKISDISDLAADYKIATGGFSTSTRAITMVQEYSDIIKRYPSDQYDHILSSHSLGGAVNMEVYNAYKDDITEVHNYNRGSGPMELISGIFGKGKDMKVIDHIVEGDPISASASRSRTNVVDIIQPLEGISQEHSMSQFLN